MATEWAWGHSLPPPGIRCPVIIHPHLLLCLPAPSYLVLLPLSFAFVTLVASAFAAEKGGHVALLHPAWRNFHRLLPAHTTPPLLLRNPTRETEVHMDLFRGMQAHQSSNPMRQGSAEAERVWVGLPTSRSRT